MADLHHLLAIYVHAHQTGNSVPPHIDADARAALAAEPPSPAPAIPLDLDALLSPKGAYEPGTGQEDGAQLVDQLEWWAPMHGCDTLENLLDRIRGRILPHLRPPIAGIDVPGPDGDYGDVLDLCAAEGVDPRVGVPLLKRALDAWKAAAQPPAPASAADGEREELADRLGWIAAQLSDIGWGDDSASVARAAALLRQPAPTPGPTIDDIWGMCEDHEFHLGEGFDDEASAEIMLQIIRVALTRWGRPAPVPVPVAERPWERPGWCDAEGRCWWSACWADWKLRRPAEVFGGWLLPHWAIPQPPQGGEVKA